MAVSDLTAARLRELFDYDPLTGVFTRRVRTAPNARRGDNPTSTDRYGYLVVRVDGHLHMVHRLVWLYVHGTFPLECIDHINGNRVDNRLANIRTSTRTGNNRNVGLTVNNTSGFKGVSWSADSKKWRAQCKVGDKNHALGYFRTPEEASAAYVSFAKQHHGEFFRS